MQAFAHIYFSATVLFSFYQTLAVKADLDNCPDLTRQGDKLEIIISEEDRVKLSNIIDEANNLGLLTDKMSEYIPAKIRYNNQEKVLKAKIRLKGKWNDHRIFPSWSLKIALREGSIFSEKKFSLQHDRTRNFHSEIVVMEYMRCKGILTPKIRYVHAFLNNQDMGYMYLEDALTENLFLNFSLPPAPILAFASDDHWQQLMINRKIGQKLTRNDFWGGSLNTPFDVDKEHTERINLPNFKNLLDSGVLNKRAIGLMRAYISGDLHSSKVFDMDVLGKYLAIAHVWGVSYTFYWTNMRFAYNANSNLFEPVAVENLVEQKDASIVFPAIYLALSSALFKSSYRKALADIGDELVSNKLFDFINKKEEQIKIIYQNENRHLEPLARGSFVSNFKKAKDLDFPENKDMFFSYQRWPHVLPEQPILENFLNVFILDIEGKNYLEFDNYSDRAVTVESIKKCTCSTKESCGNKEELLSKSLTIPNGLVPTKRKRYDLGAEDLASYCFYVTSTYDSKNIIYNRKAIPLW